MVGMDIGLLHDALIELRPTGESGFEGVVKTALSALTGLRFYSSKSGRQEGRDGGTGPGSFDVVFEAKRYNHTKFDERELIAELVQATRSCPDLDLYVVATTAVADELAVRELSGVAEDQGVDLLILDWESKDIPMLAVFLSHARDAVVEWFRKRGGETQAAEIDTILRSIASHPRHKLMTDRIRLQLSNDSMGQAALQSKVRTSLRAIFSDRIQARQKFFQFLAPNSPEAKAIERPRFTEAIQQWWAINEPGTALAVLGQEGVGKSWAIPQWWLGLDIESAPALVLIPSWRLHSRRSAFDGNTMLAEGIAHLIGDDDEKSVAKLKKRLKRWRRREGGPSEWLVILDGLNESTNFPWAGTIENLADLADRLGLRIAVTCRGEFWQTDVNQRLYRVQAKQLLVDDYDDGELDTALAIRRIAPDSLGPQVKKLIRNPRLLSIADNLLSSLGTGELTRDRLLFEYWAARLKERGDLISHNRDDMQALLVEHARALRDGISKFPINSWKDFSGAAKRLSPAQIQNDLSDIVDGRYFEADGISYRPRAHALPFALGLLLVQELKASSWESIDNVVNDAIDPIQGMDLTSEILGSAAALSLMDGAPAKVSLALFRRWLSLQNVSEDEFYNLAAYVPANPSLYLDLLEELYGYLNHPRREWVTEALRLNRDHPKVGSVLAERLKRWMGLWCFETDSLPPPSSMGDQVTAHDVERKQKIRQRIESLTPDESATFEGLCTQVENPYLVQVAQSVSHIAEGWHLVPLAEGVLAWSLAVELCHRHIRQNDVDWLFDANFVDFEKTREELLFVANESLVTASTHCFKDAVARTFLFAGLPEDIDEACRVFQLSQELGSLRSKWFWLEAYCDVDPFDPGSPDPQNIVNAEDKINAMKADDVDSQFMVTLEQRLIEGLTGGLARFNPTPIILLWHRVLDTLATRQGMPMRQLCLALPEISPLLRSQDISRIEARLLELNGTQHSLGAGENFIISTGLFEAIAPHLDGDGQLNLLSRSNQGSGSRFSLRLANLFKSASPLSYEEHLSAAFKEGVDALVAILFFASTGKQPLTVSAKEIISKCMLHDNSIIRCLAFQITVKSRDPFLLDALYACNWQYDRDDVNERESYYGSVALVMAAVRRGKEVPLLKISPELWGYACESLSDEHSHEIYGHFLRQLVERMSTSEAGVMPPRMVIQIREGTGHEFMSFSRDTEIEEKDEDSFEAFAKTSRGFDPEGWKREHQVFVDRFYKSLRTLKEQGLTALLEAPWGAGFRILAERNASALLEVAEILLKVPSGKLQTQVRNWALAMVPTLASVNEDLASHLYQRYSETQPLIRVVTGPAQIPREISILMETEGTVFDNLRRDSFFHSANDRRIAILTLSAEQNGRGAWLRRFARECIAERQPMRISLGLTILGYCDERVVPGELFRYDGLVGDLANTAESAKYASERNVWAHQWYEMAHKAKTFEEMWRFGELMVRIADFRYCLWLKIPDDTSTSTPWGLFGNLYSERFQSSGKERSDKRKEKLYGRNVPSTSFLAMLNLTT